MHFILNAKPGDHEFLFDQVIAAIDKDRVTTISWKVRDGEAALSFVNNVPLNEANQELLVNFFHYVETGPDGETRKVFTFVTDLRITCSNARLLVRGGRAQWKIENETFNTLKNQGYHYEHNYGHGKQHLSVVFAMLMMLAFLVDQVQQRCCPLFQAVAKKLGSQRALWDHLSHFRHFTFQSMLHLYDSSSMTSLKNCPRRFSILPKDAVLAVAAAAILAIQTLFCSSPTGLCAHPITNHHHHATDPPL